MKMIVSLFLLMIAQFAICLGQEPFYINYTIDDGLPSNEVYDVEIDDNGVLWFTTDRGVCTYDSYNFVAYTTHDGLCDNVNFEIFKDSEGALWFFGYNGKITIYDDGKFVPYRYNDELQLVLKSIGGDYIKEIQEGEDGSLYLVCNSQLTKEFIVLKNNLLPRLFKPLVEASKFKIDSFYFLFNTYKKAYTLKYCISYRNRLDEDMAQLDQTLNYSFIYDDQSLIWFSTSKNKGIKKRVRNMPTVSLLFEDFQITNIIKDYNNGYWLTTTNKGVLNVPNIDVKLLSILLESKGSFLKFHEFNESLLCGTTNSNLLVIDSVNNVKEYSINLLDYSFDLDHFQDVNNGNTVRISGFEIESSNKKLLFHSDSNKRKNIVTSKGDTIIKTNIGITVHKLNREILFVKGEEKSVSLVEDKQNRIWVGTLDGVILIDDFDYENRKIIRSFNDVHIGRVNDVVVDSFNNIWICTIGNGIFIKTKDEVVHFTSDDGLSSNIVNTAEVGRNKNIWIATNKGLNLLTYDGAVRNLKMVASFDQTDGLNSNYINDVIGWNSKIYVASPNGICYFDPKDILKPNVEIPLSILSVFVKDSLMNADQLAKLKHNNDPISIRYRAIRYNKSKNQKLYKYQLNRNSKAGEWISTNETEAIYDNLNHGDYVFNVTAVNKEGEWNKDFQSISFKVMPRYYETVWFKIIMGFLMLAFIASLNLFFTRRYQERKRNELELEMAKTKATKAELSAIRNQMNPHFIFNSLNSIQNLIFKKDVTGANHYLSKFSTLIRKSLEYSRVNYITIENELLFIKNYIELEKLRFPDMFDITYNIDPNLTVTHDKMPSLIIQPIIENSIKHAFKNIDRKGLIKLSIYQKEENSIEIVIEDNGAGMIKDWKPKSKKHNSLGLNLVTERVKILKTSFPKADFYYFNLDKDGESGVRSTLILPLQ